jgi:glycosyltransferase involved in cell wall biosynthesis
MIEIAKNISNVNFVKGKNIHLFDKRFYICLQPGIHQWLREYDPDVVILEANPRYLSSRKAIQWIKKEGKGLIGWGLGVPNHSGKLSKIVSETRFQFLRNFDEIIAYSKHGKQQYVKAGIPEEIIHIAPNSTAPKPDFPPPIREQVFQNGRAILLFVGRLQTRKRVDSLIRACAQISEDQQPDLWVVGDGLILNDLKSYANLNYPRTKFWGAVYGKELEEIFKRADLFVLPGTGGLAIQQAMSYALPVIVAEGDGSQSNMVFPENGWIIPANDENVLVSTIKKAISDPAELREMGNNAYDIIANHINIDIMTEVFITSIIETFKLRNKYGR